MHTLISLDGEWGLQLDGDKTGLSLPFRDTILLPGTTSHAQKGPKQEEKLTGALTDPYLFEGFAWYVKEIEIPAELAARPCYLFLERTRKTTVWLDDRELGSQDSLNTPHRYALTGLLKAGRHTLTVRVDNTDYPTRGGHLTSPDTQTNWNGITGRIELQFHGSAYLTNVQVYPDADTRSVTLKARLNGTGASTVTLSAASWNGENDNAASSWNSELEHGTYERTHAPGAVSSERTYPLSAVASECTSPLDASATGISLNYPLGDDALLWSEFEPQLYRLTVDLRDAEGKLVDREEVVFGLRAFQADHDKFTINGAKTFLRGKHDGLVFPLTGYAPTDVEEWLRILRIAKSYGINHYRFHTCCPPEAAFTAADMLGIYMEPELPFWGTITEEGEANHNQAEQDYLVQEGLAMLDAYGNHPSFVMLSLGNELWGSRPRIDAILAAYKQHDNRHLYTQGSNNHQFAPAILEHDDFFCGVRFSRERLFRGSYAMCDAPLGHVQTDYPSTMKDYDEEIAPLTIRLREAAAAQEPEQGHGQEQSEGTMEIQYGTGTKTVAVDASAGEWVPHVPVISHEIGQYGVYPNYSEIAKYTGALKAENLAIFRQRLEEKGLGHLANAYFSASGQLAVDCYKEELEAAFRSRRLAGFQLLDLQDFPGQGTALVGVLDAFMDSKGLISPEEWRTFCSDAVLLARFERYQYIGGEHLEAHVELAWYRSDQPAAVEMEWELAVGGEGIAAGAVSRKREPGEPYLDLADLDIPLPLVDQMTSSLLSLRIAGTDVRKSYELWIYPREAELDWTGIHRCEALTAEALDLLHAGGNVLLMPRPEQLGQGIEGFYCTDFWNYPMFRSISESVNRPVPVGTMGLLIDNKHPVFRDFPCQPHSTYPWWSILSNGKSVIMDKAGREWSPLVQTIDNVERNHKLGLLLECRVGSGKLLICPLDTGKAAATTEGKQFLISLTRYVRSADFQPDYEASVDELLDMLQTRSISEK